MHFQQTEQSSADIEFLHQLDSYCLNIHRSLHHDEIAAVVVNDARALLQVDRVSLCALAGRKCIAKAISGQDRVVVRSTAVKHLEKLATAVADTGEPLRYDGQSTSFANDDQLAEYVAESQARVILIVPLTQNPRRLIDLQNPEPAREDAERTIGYLIIEQFAANELTPELEARTLAVASHAANALQNVRQHNRIFLLPMLTWIGTMLGWFEGKKRWAAIALLSVMAAFTLACFLLPWQYRVSARGTLMPSIRQELYSPWDAQVAEIFVRDGQDVKRDEPLLQLKSSELSIQRVQTLTELSELKKQIASLNLQAEDARRANEFIAEARLQGEISRSEVLLAGTQAQLDLVDQRLASLLIKSPVDGTVAAFDVQQLLADRPVARGENLLQIADLSSDWRLELAIPEHRSGHVLAASTQSDTPLEVDFVLATDIERRLSGQLERVGTRVNESEESGGAMVQGIVGLDESTQQHLSVKRIGSEVHAKLHCGRRSLGYVLFGDVIEFVATRIWL